MELFDVWVGFGCAAATATERTKLKRIEKVEKKKIKMLGVINGYENGLKN